MMVFNSKEYWENRYVNGGNSGAGSYGRLAEFKAQVVNDFVEKNNIMSVIELGCGDGNQLGLYNFDKYLGLDISKKTIEICINKFFNDASKSFLVYDGNFSSNSGLFLNADLTISIDVIFHLVEDEIFEKYLRDLFEMSNRFVIIYSSNNQDEENRETIHVRHRKFTDWVRDNISNWVLEEKINNKHPLINDSVNESFADFYIYSKK